MSNVILYDLYTCGSNKKTVIIDADRACKNIFVINLSILK